MHKFRDIKLADIKISPGYKKYSPREGKVEEKTQVLKAGKQLCVTVTPDGVLLDGYAAYLAMLGTGVGSCRAYVVETMAVVFGYHLEAPEKIYKWRLRFKGCDKVAQGDHLAVATRFGVREAVVSGIEEMNASETLALRDSIGFWDAGKYAGKKE